ncbi:hypothetical protein BDZ45DRAFT_737960 [Acephala macrosclerotiorum]|nr:hypothetical protein BDZ45DRAFT_737960 [Acephala macrosclerotiorum]
MCYRKDMEIVEPSRAPNLVPEESQPWWPFFLGIEDKLQSADRSLVVRIGGAEALGNEPVNKIYMLNSDSVQSFSHNTQTAKSSFAPCVSTRRILKFKTPSQRNTPTQELGYGKPRSVLSDQVSLRMTQNQVSDGSHLCQLNSPTMMSPIALSAKKRSGTFIIVNFERECPLCLKAMSSAKYLSRHIGHHLRQLSLASLPPVRTSAEDDGKPEKGVSIDQSVSSTVPDEL